MEVIVQKGPIGISFEGNVITEVVANSQAEKLGIRVGCLILQVNGEKQPNDHDVIAQSIQKTHKVGAPTILLLQEKQDVRKMFQSLQKKTSKVIQSATIEATRQTLSIQNRNKSQDHVTEQSQIVSSVREDTDQSSNFPAIIRKKDELLKQSHEEMERMIKILSEKEKRILLLQEKNNTIGVLQKQLKEKDALMTLIKKRSYAESTRAKNSQVNSLTEALTEANSKNAIKLKQLKDMEQKLWIKDKEINDTKQLLLATEKVRKTQKIKLDELTQRIENSSNKHNMEKQILQQETGKAKEFHKEKISQARMEWEQSMKERENELEQLKIQLENTEKELGSTQMALETSEKALETNKSNQKLLQQSEEKLREEVINLKKKVEETELNNKIAAKKRNRLVKELKSDLKKSTQKAKRVEAELKDKKEELLSFHSVLKEHVQDMRKGNSNSPNRERSINSRKAINIESNKSSVQSSRKGSHSPSGSRDSFESAPPSYEIEVEVSAALSRRLEHVTNTNHKYRTKILSLEKNIRILNEDLAEKKKIIQSFIRRIQTGALTATDAQHTTKNSELYGNLRPEAKAKLFRKMEIVFQETMLENIHLKDNLKQMGTEVTQLINSKKEHQDAYNILKVEYESLKKKHQITTTTTITTTITAISTITTTAITTRTITATTTTTTTTVTTTAATTATTNATVIATTTATPSIATTTTTANLSPVTINATNDITTTTNTVTM